MASTSLTPSASDPRLTETILRTFDHAALSTKHQQYLSDIGLDKKAQRLADIDRQWNWYNASADVNDRSDVWRQAPYTSMLRTDIFLAARTTKDHIAQYSAFAELIVDHFMRLDFVFYSPKSTLDSPAHAEDREIVRTVRKLLNAELPESLDKLGACTDKGGRWNRRVKVLYPVIADAATLAEIRSQLPAGVFLHAHVHPKSAFDKELRFWAAADLPADDLERADMELFLHGLQQVAPHKIPKETTRKFALQPKTPNANLPHTFEELESTLLPSPSIKPSVYVPRSPKTGRPARFVSVTVDRDTRIEDIHPAEWTALPPPE